PHRGRPRSESENAGQSASNECEAQKSRFQWSRIAQSYTGRLRLIPTDQLEKRADTLENAALYQYLAAFQSKSSENFHQGIVRALHSQGGASALFEQSGSSSRAKLLRSKALEECLRSRLSLRSQENNVRLERSSILAKNPLQIYDSTNSIHESVATCNQLERPVQSAF